MSGAVVTKPIVRGTDYRLSDRAFQTDEITGYNLGGWQLLGWVKYSAEDRDVAASFTQVAAGTDGNFEVLVPAAVTATLTQGARAAVFVYAKNGTRVVPLLKGVVPIEVGA